jgi:hypothetical protein
MRVYYDTVIVGEKVLYYYISEGVNHLRESVFVCPKNGVVEALFFSMVTKRNRLEISMNRPGTSGHDFPMNADFSGQKLQSYRSDCLSEVEGRGPRVYSTRVDDPSTIPRSEEMWMVVTGTRKWGK